MSPLILAGGRGVGERVEGEALVSQDAFSARYDLDRATGIISRPGHAIEGQSIAGKILVFPTAKGGMAASWALNDLCARQLGPRGLIFGRANPVVVQGAIFARIPIIDGLQPDPLTVIKSGDWLCLDPAAGTVAVTPRDARR